MKKIIILCCIGLEIALAIDQEDAAKACIAELDLPPNIEQYFDEKLELKDNTYRNATCMFYCVAYRSGLTDEKGSVDKDRISSYLIHRFPDESKPDLVNSYFSACGDRTETDACGRWYEFIKCGIRWLPKVWSNLKRRHLLVAETSQLKQHNKIGRPTGKSGPPAYQTVLNMFMAPQKLPQHISFG